MKLAEALTKIKDCKGRIAKLSSQLTSRTTVTKLAEEQVIPNNDHLIDDIVDLTGQLAHLKSRVVATNVKHGLIRKIHELQEAKFMVTTLEPLTSIEQAEHVMESAGYGSPAVKVEKFATFNVKNAKKLFEEAQQHLRALDLELQKQNWVIDLVE